MLGSRDMPMMVTQAQFLRESIEKYPTIYPDRKKVEFFELQQNDLSVVDYKVQFMRLSRYAPEEVAMDELKRNIFERGLKLEIREKLVV